MKYLVVLASLLMAGSSLADQPQPLVRNYETQGNLASTSEPACFPLAKATNKLTPADLFQDLKLCINKDDYTDAVDLFALAGVYGRYDMKRVADQSAHEAIGALQMETFDGISDDKRKLFSDELHKKAQKDSDDLKQLCTSIRAIGAPDYFPAYMIQHGMNAMMTALGGKANSDDGLVKGFDSIAAWGSALGGYLHCPTQ